MKKTLLLWLSALSLFLIAGAMLTFAQRRSIPALAATIPFSSARPDIRVTLAATVQRDDKTIRTEEAGLIQPGEMLTWTITSENIGGAAAHQYKAVGRIPAGTVFVAGSAHAASEPAITYSLDHGKTFSARPTIPETQPDGTIKQAPAPVAMYTQVRFEWNTPLAAGQTLTANYKVRVR